MMFSHLGMSVRQRDRRVLPIVGALVLLPLLLTACQPGEPDSGEQDPREEESSALSLAERLAGVRMVELTHPFNGETLVWPTSDHFTFETTFDGWTADGYYYASRNFAGPEHGGTHLDAPIHFADGRWTTDEIPLERLMGPAAVIDVSQQAGDDPDYQVRVDDLIAWEAEHGRLPDGAILMLFTDRSRLWPDAERYMGTSRVGEDGVAELSFPGLHPDAAHWLVAERAIAAVGIDTPSIDHGPSTLFEAHRVLLESNIYALENVAHLERLPPQGATILALPMFLEGGTGGPVRIIGLLEPPAN